jgi:hypothetical protein
VTLAKVPQSSHRADACAFTLGGMRNKHILTIVGFLMVCASASGKQIGSWDDVKDLSPGARISVKASAAPADRCYFVSATDQELVCVTGSSGPLPYTHFTFERRTIRRIRLEHSDNYNTVVGGLLGAGIGAALGANSHQDGPGLDAFKVGTFFGVIGACVGRALPILHGKVVYSR